MSKDNIIGALVAAACVIGIIAGGVFINERVRCFDTWPFSPSKVCVAK